jgi:hypothetical protein
MTDLPELCIWTKANQASALLARLTIDQEGVHEGCRCHLGYLPPYEGRFGLMFPPEPMRIYRSTEESKLAFVMRYFGVPAQELGLAPVKIAWSRLKGPVRRAVDRIDCVIAQDGYKQVAADMSDEDKELAALLGSIA